MKRETACDLLQVSRVKERETSKILAEALVKNADMKIRVNLLEEDYDDNAKVRRMICFYVQTIDNFIFLFTHHFYSTFLINRWLWQMLKLRSNMIIVKY